MAMVMGTEMATGMVVTVAMVEMVTAVMVAVMAVAWVKRWSTYLSE